ncbi:Cytoplasmic and mitochondrial histidine tRNA synthetase [Apiotrichum porosum]|uniref:Histidine--tRNA ligase, mitochondrial n=1 Tax=Apiotrichum porosum TaxID=105984 RepID=A0A427XCG7_9TREE|nr:Cytoplasmic and mitochondrial histidine tRNA synthetase [Apiotrichum porosum]RSH76581.1 Cytoplasmic and mitochondrial histidine tRNA synthetase [Apiotrichum porosum]
MSPVDDRIKELQEKIKALKVAKQDASKEVDEMKALKAQQTKDKKDGPAGFQLKVPKGTLDHKPAAALLRKKIFNTLENIFTTHGAETIDTPVFELKDILAGKYGEDSKLIYDLQDQGGELCSLRYDLTVPFARYVAMNGITSMKRYHIAKVYRRDQPVMSKGRMREFYQCDFDIAGNYDAMVPDAEIMLILTECLEQLEIGDFTIKINHRKILDGIFELAGVPADKIRAISSAVDKLDKLPWADVKKEMTVEKGLDPVIADRIGEYVGIKGEGREVLARLQGDEKLNSIPSAKAGLDDMAILFDYLENCYGILGRFSFDMSLARGLDYYTGIIYEAVTDGSAPAAPAAAAAEGDAKTKGKKAAKVVNEDGVDESAVGVGSIAAGGRYDNLVNMFAEAAGSKRSELVPCVGVSIGVERVYAILEQRRRAEAAKPRSKETQVYVMALGGGLLPERMKFAKQLWDAGIKAEFMYKAKPKAPAQWAVADNDQVRYVAILAPAELAKGIVRIKEQGVEREAGQDNGEEVEIDKVVEYLKQRL